MLVWQDQSLGQILSWKDLQSFYAQGRSTHTEGCHKILIAKRVRLLVWSIFSLSEGSSSSRVRWTPRYPASHSYQCFTDQHNTCLVVLVHSRPKPKPALTAWTQAPKQAQFWPANTKESIAGRKDAAEHPSQRQRLVTPPDQLSAASHRNSCHVVPFQKPSHLQNPHTAEEVGDGQSDAPSQPQCCPLRAGRGRQTWSASRPGEAAAGDTSKPSLQTLLPLDTAATGSNPE